MPRRGWQAFWGRSLYCFSQELRWLNPWLLGPHRRACAS